jgi:hypothetical protein
MLNNARDFYLRALSREYRPNREQLGRGHLTLAR